MVIQISIFVDKIKKSTFSVVISAHTKLSKPTLNSIDVYILFSEIFINHIYIRIHSTIADQK